ncbi:MAG: hypothetical protein IT371_31650 [Deltaproteobacteria bacterium]|nr:hypothetical protein [Deltaproteobacteria bacterium]
MGRSSLGRAGVGEARDRRSRGRWLLSAVLVVAALAGPARTGGAPKPGGAHLAVVVHPVNPLKELSLAQLKDIFLKTRTQWGLDRAIVVFNAEPLSPLRLSFDKQVLGLSGQAAASYWIDRRIRGLGMPPKSVGAPSLLVRIVARQRDAIGYVPLDKVAAGVKVLRIEGKAPGEPGYALHLEARP